MYVQGRRLSDTDISPKPLTALENTTLSRPRGRAGPTQALHQFFLWEGMTLGLSGCSRDCMNLKVRPITEIRHSPTNQAHEAWGGVEMWGWGAPKIYSHFVKSLMYLKVVPLFLIQLSSSFWFTLKGRSGFSASTSYRWFAGEGCSIVTPPHPLNSHIFFYRTWGQGPATSHWASFCCLGNGVRPGAEEVTTLGKLLVLSHTRALATPESPRVSIIVTISLPSSGPNFSKP